MFYLTPRGVPLKILGGGVPLTSPNPDPISDPKVTLFTPFFRPGARFSKVPIINGPGKLSNMIKLSVNETKWSSLLARTRALILYFSI